MPALLAAVFCSVGKADDAMVTKAAKPSSFPLGQLHPFGFGSEQRAAAEAKGPVNLALHCANGCSWLVFACWQGERRPS